MRKKILVIGGSGKLGIKICEAIRDTVGKGVHLVIGDYNTDRGRKTADHFSKSSSCHIDVSDRNSLQISIKREISCVIVALKQVEPIVQNICAGKGIPCIDVSMFSEFSKKVENMLPHSSSVSVVMAGLCPGISAIMVKESIKKFDIINEVSVNHIQSFKSVKGFTGFEDKIISLSQPLSSGARGFSDYTKETVDSNTYLCREINHGDIQILKDKLKIPVLKYRTCWDNERYNRKINFVLQHGLLDTYLKLTNKFYFRSDKNPDEKPSYLQVNATGIAMNETFKKKIEMKIFSEYITVAYFIALLTKKIIYNPTKYDGVMYPFEMISFKDILDLENQGILTIRTDEELSYRSTID